MSGRSFLVCQPLLFPASLGLTYPPLLSLLLCVALGNTLLTDRLDCTFDVSLFLLSSFLGEGREKAPLVLCVTCTASLWEVVVLQPSAVLLLMKLNDCDVFQFQAKTKNCCARTSLGLQWLRIHAHNSGGLGLVPAQGTRFHMPQLKILHATTKTQCCQVTTY